MNKALATAISKYPHLAAFVEVAGERLDALELEQVLIYLIEIVDAGAIPILAAQFDVEGYKGMSLADTEGEQRDIIRRAIDLHRKKGTPFAVIEAVRNAGYEGAQIERNIGRLHDGSARYEGRIRHAGIEQNWAAFNLIINTGGAALDESKIRKYVREYKPVRSMLIRLDSAPPAPVENIQITYQWDGFVELTGTPTAGENIAGYNAYYDYGFGVRKDNTDLLDAAALDGYLFEDLPVGHSYSFWFTAVDAAGVESEPSVKALTNVISAAPVDVELVRAGDTYVELTAAPGPEADTAGYNAYYNAGAGPVQYNTELLTDSDLASYLFEGLTNGTDYTFWFTGVSNAGQEGSASDTVEATPAFAAPAPVELLEAWDTSVRIAAGPGQGADIDGYNAYYDAGGGAVKHNAALLTAGDIADYDFDGLTNGTAYDFWFTGVDGGGRETSPSAVISATPVSAPPVDVMLLEEGDRAASIGAMPGGNSYTAGYNAYYDDGTGAVKHNTGLLSDGDISDYEFGGLVNGETYDIWFTAVSELGSESGPSAVVQATPFLLAPENLELTAQAEFIDASVDPNPVAAAYNWYLDGVLQDSTGTRFYRFEGLTPGTEYTVAVSVTGGGGDESAQISDTITTPIVCDIAIDSVTPEYVKAPAEGWIDVLNNGIAPVAAQGYIDVISNNLAPADVASEGWIDVSSNAIGAGNSETHTVTVGADSIPGVVVEGGGGSASEAGRKSFSGSFGVEGCQFSPDGTKMYVLYTASDIIEEYDLSTPWIMSSGTLANTLNIRPDADNSYDFFISNDGTRLYIINRTVEELDSYIQEYTLSTAWDISTAVHLQSLFTGLRTHGLFLKTDGTGLIMVGPHNNDLSDHRAYYFELSTAWDISTAVLIRNHALDEYSDGSTSNRGLALSPDGLNMFIPANASDAALDGMYRYSLSTPWDISTAVFNEFLHLGTSSSTIRGAALGNNGMNLFYLNTASDDVVSLDLPAPYTLSTVTAEQKAAIAYAAAINNDATVSADWTASVVDQGGGTWRCLITAKETGEAFNGETVAVTGATDVTLTTSDTSGGAKGSEIHTVTVGTDSVPVTVTGGGDPAEESAAIAYADAINGDATIAADWLATVEDNAGTWRCLITAREAGPDGNGATVDVTGETDVTVSTADTSGGSAAAPESHTITIGADSIPGIEIKGGGGPPVFGESFNVNPQDSLPRNVMFKPDGLKMFIIGSDSNAVHSYNLSTAWDVTTASLNNSFDVSAQGGNPTGVTFNPDGLQMFVVYAATRDVYAYDLSTAWDISTAVFDNSSFDVSGQDSDPHGVTFNPDGTQMFIVGIGNDRVYAYDLSTAWDISTASFVQSFDVNAQEHTPTEVVFSPEGEKMFIVGVTFDIVHSYSLETPWDISTAAFLRSFDVSAQTTAPQGMTFSPDGLRLFVIGNSPNSAVYSYTLPAPWYIGDTTPEQATALTYAAAVNGDAVVSEEWTASVEDNGDDTWRCLITALPVGPELNGTAIAVTGAVDVTVSTEDTAGGEYTINITAAASSTRTPIEYSLWADDAPVIDWQAVGTFNDVAPDQYTVHARDTGGCEATEPIQVV